MKKTTVLIISLMIISALIIAGCGQQETNTQSPYIGGKKGLSIKFQQHRPPETIYSGRDNEEGSTFSVGVQLENLGEEGIDCEEDENDFGRLTLRGIKAQSYGIENNDTVINFEEEGIELRPVQRTTQGGPVSQGGIANIEFPSMNYQHTSQGFNEVTFTVDLCYNYKTKSTTNICIVPDNDARDTVCEPTGSKTTSNSGGPVHVKSVLENPSKDKIGLTIEIAKVDNTGNVYAPISPDVPTDERVCDDATSNSDKNRLYVNVTLPEGGDMISCSNLEGGNEGMVYLYEGSPALLFCNINTEDVERDYETQLSIDLEYAYGHDIRKTVTLASR